MAFHWSATLTAGAYTPGTLAKVEREAAVGEGTLREFLHDMLLIRRFEERVEERFRAGELPGFLHVAIGQEAVAVGVCRAMEEDDIFASTHRAHGHTLARGSNPRRVMAELYGKVEGVSHGYGGSMHLYDIERGNYGANAVIGGGLPAVTGAGLAFKMRDEPRVAVAFFGDGATNIGTFHESLNLAQLWRTKTVFVCENNHWAESTPGWQHSPVWDDMSKRALAFNMRSIKVDGQDVEAVYAAAARGARVRPLRRGPGLPRRPDLPHARPLHRRPAGVPLEGGSRGGGRTTIRSRACASGSAYPTRSSRRSTRKRSASSRTRSSSRRTAPTRSPKTR